MAFNLDAVGRPEAPQFNNHIGDVPNTVLVNNLSANISMKTINNKEN